MKRTTTTKLHDGIKPTSEKIIVGRLNTTISAEINILCSEFVAIGYRHTHTHQRAPGMHRRMESLESARKLQVHESNSFRHEVIWKINWPKIFRRELDVGGNIFYEYLRLQDNLLDNIIQSVRGVKFQKKFASRICLLYTQNSG